MREGIFPQTPSSGPPRAVQTFAPLASCHSHAHPWGWTARNRRSARDHATIGAGQGCLAMHRPVLVTRHISSTRVAVLGGKGGSGGVGRGERGAGGDGRGGGRGDRGGGGGGGGGDSSSSDSGALGALAQSRRLLDRLSLDVFTALEVSVGMGSSTAQKSTKLRSRRRSLSMRKTTQCWAGE